MFGIKRLIGLLERLSNEAILFNNNYKRVNAKCLAEEKNEEIIGYAIMRICFGFGKVEKCIVSEIFKCADEAYKYMDGHDLKTSAIYHYSVIKLTAGYFKDGN